MRLMKPVVAGKHELSQTFGKLCFKRFPVDDWLFRIFSGRAITYEKRRLPEYGSEELHFRSITGNREQYWKRGQAALKNQLGSNIR